MKYRQQSARVVGVGTDDWPRDTWTAKRYTVVLRTVRPRLEVGHRSLSAYKEQGVRT